MGSGNTDAAAHFVAKWLQREPEMQFAELFCPAGQKPLFRSWGALLHELREAMFELGDASVTRAKTAWWAEEILGLDRGQARHPLSETLLGIDAPWAVLSRSMLEQDDSPIRAADTAGAIAALLPLAAATVSTEAAVFRAAPSADAARSLAIHWLLQRVPTGLVSEDRARIPMHLFARHGSDALQHDESKVQALLRDWAGELGMAMPVDVGQAAMIRRSRHQFDKVRLQRLAAGKGNSEPWAPATLWRARRIARTQRP